ncbi:high choriolytic enzyme 1-like [Labrus bergylta]|uniref:high choriolytic enzyme 1-like n=1 Tax=Labrus bergylta TaxID=56723 RepID=UPI00331430EE
MIPSASLLLLLLLGLSQALPLQEEGSAEEEEEVPDGVDITTRILTSNNGTDEILLEGDLLAPKTRNAMMCWSQSCLWKKTSNGLVMIPFTVNSQFTSGERQKIDYAMKGFHRKTCLRFVPRKNEDDYISIENKAGQNWFLEHDDEFTVLKRRPQSPDLNPTFGMWWNGRFVSWMCSRQICSNCVMLSC